VLRPTGPLRRRSEVDRLSLLFPLLPLPPSHLAHQTGQLPWTSASDVTVNIYVSRAAVKAHVEKNPFCDLVRKA
jgi:hypothetical protein